MLYTLDKKLKKENKFLKYFSMSIVSILLGLVGTFIIALIIGFRPIIINGGSMLPTLTWGDLIIIYKPPQEEIKVGDILTFQFNSGELCTHRITGINENGDYITEGDNPNNDQDSSPVSYNKKDGLPTVVGITYYIIPSGNLIQWLLVIPNTISLAAGIWLLFELHKASKDFCDRNAEEL